MGELHRNPKNNKTRRCPACIRGGIITEKLGTRQRLFKRNSEFDENPTMYFFTWPNLLIRSHSPSCGLFTEISCLHPSLLPSNLLKLLYFPPSNPSNLFYFSLKPLQQLQPPLLLHSVCPSLLCLSASGLHRLPAAASLSQQASKQQARKEAGLSARPLPATN